MQLPTQVHAWVAKPTRRSGALPAVLVQRIKIAHRPRGLGGDNDGASDVVSHHGVEPRSGVATSTRRDAVHRVTVPAGESQTVVRIGSVKTAAAVCEGVGVGLLQWVNVRAAFDTQGHHTVVHHRARPPRCATTSSITLLQFGSDATM